MDLFLLHTQSVMAFILALAAGAMFFHLTTLKEKVEGKHWLMMLFFGIMGWQLENMLRFSMPLSYVGTWAYKVQTVFVFIPVFGLLHLATPQFAYVFLHRPFESERRLVLRISVVLLLAEIGLMYWLEFYHGSQVERMGLLVTIFGLIANLWILLTYLRKAWAVRKHDAQAVHAFLAMAIVEVCFIAASVFSGLFGFFTFVGYLTFFSLVWIGNLAQIVIFITYAAVPTSFLAKLVGFTFVLVLSILSVVTLVFFPPVPLEAVALRITQQEGLYKLAGIIAGSALLVLLVFPLLLRKSLIQPLRRLLEGVQRVNAGDLTTQVLVGMPDELGVVTQSFNHMTHSLQLAQQQLTRYAGTLEAKVSERTAQLQEANYGLSQQKEKIATQRDHLEQTLVELQATQAQLIQKEKMASLGELTAGIAHEIQNPLNFVNNFAELSADLLEELGEEMADFNLSEQEKANAMDLISTLSQNERKILHHGRRADLIVKGMLEHSRSGTSERQSTNLNALAEEYLRLAFHRSRVRDHHFNVRLVTDLDPALPPIQAVPEEIGRVLLNVFNNAFDSISEKKKQLGERFQPQVKVRTQRTGEQVEVWVRDNGTGIAEAVREKIYQPFFTTKPTGEGTGLGLSLSYDIITKGHGGKLMVNSQEGEFAEFVIQLPQQ